MACVQGDRRRNWNARCVCTRSLGVQSSASEPLPLPLPLPRGIAGLLSETAAFLAGISSCWIAALSITSRTRRAPTSRSCTRECMIVTPLPFQGCSAKQNHAGSFLITDSHWLLCRTASRPLPMPYTAEQCHGAPGFNPDRRGHGSADVYGGEGNGAPQHYVHKYP